MTETPLIRLSSFSGLRLGFLVGLKDKPLICARLKEGILAFRPILFIPFFQGEDNVAPARLSHNRLRHRW